MQKIVSVVTKVSSTKKDDDFADRLSHRVTVVILVVFAIIVTAALSVGKAITCWVPKHFTGSHTKYTNSYCWVKNTYYLPFEEYVPRAHEEKQEILYYQWLPFIFLLQALFFYLPSTVWHGLNQKAGVDCDNILSCANQLEKIEKVERREKTLTLLTKQIHRFLTARIDSGSPKLGVESFLARTLCFCCGRRVGNYLSILFIVSKVLYIANVIAQLFILNAVLRTSYNIFGFEFLANYGTQDYWSNTNTFPRVTMCDFRVRRLGNVQRYTVQCVLPINMYTEKIYTFLWFWMVFVAAVSVINLIIWFGRLVSPNESVAYIKNHVREAVKKGSDVDPELIKKFANQYLKTDGVFILRLISHNTNFITSTEVIKELWKFWLHNVEKHTITPTNEPETERLKGEKDL